MPAAPLNSLATATTPWLVSEWKSVVTALALVAIVVWVLKRTRSTHVLHAMLWRKLFKQRSEGPAWLSEFLDERDHLMRFRAQTGLALAPNLAAGRRIVAWAEQHGLDIDKVAAVQDLLDFDKPGMKERTNPHPKMPQAIGLFCGLFLLGAVACFVAGAFLPAAIKVVQSQEWYAVKPDGAKRWFRPESGKSVSFKVGHCADQTAIAARTGYTAHDVTVLCDLMTTPDGIDAVEDARTGQQVLAFAAAVWLLLLGRSLYAAYRETKAASEVHGRLEALKPKAATEAWPESACSMAGAGTAPPPPSKSEIDFVWDHWKFNADQRIKAFNFFVVFSVFANGGLFTAIDKCAHPLALGIIGLFIGLLATIFWMIDTRSRVLIQLSVDGIKRYERGLWERARLFHLDEVNAHRFVRYSNSFRILFCAQIALGVLVLGYAIGTGTGLTHGWLPALATCKP